MKSLKTVVSLLLVFAVATVASAQQKPSYQSNPTATTRSASNAKSNGQSMAASSASSTASKKPVRMSTAQVIEKVNIESSVAVNANAGAFRISNQGVQLLVGFDLGFGSSIVINYLDTDGSGYINGATLFAEYIQGFPLEIRGLAPGQAAITAFGYYGPNLLARGVDQNGDGIADITNQFGTFSDVDGLLAKGPSDFLLGGLDSRLVPHTINGLWGATISTPDINSFLYFNSSNISMVKSSSGQIYSLDVFGDFGTRLTRIDLNTYSVWWMGEYSTAVALTADGNGYINVLTANGFDGQPAQIIRLHEENGGLAQVGVYDLPDTVYYSADNGFAALASGDMYVITHSEFSDTIYRVHPNGAFFQLIPQVTGPANGFHGLGILPNRYQPPPRSRPVPPQAPVSKPALNRKLSMLDAFRKD